MGRCEREDMVTDLDISKVDHEVRPEPTEVDPEVDQEVPSKVEGTQIKHVYGDHITADQQGFIRCVQTCFLVICPIGVVLQFIQIWVEPVGWACVLVYFAYNVMAVTLARLFLVILKFEERESLIVGIRITAAMAVYGVVIGITLAWMENSTMLLLMAVCGLINVVILIPASIRELSLLHTSRSKGIGTTHSVTLSDKQNKILIFVLVFCYIVLLGCTSVSTIIIATLDDGGVLWYVLLGFYVCLNILVLITPRVAHWVETDTQLWPIQQFIGLNVAVLVTSICLTISFFILDDDDIKRLFGVIGVVNGLLGACAMGGTMWHILHNPRTTASTEIIALEEGKAGAQ